MLKMGRNHVVVSPFAGTKRLSGCCGRHHKGRRLLHLVCLLAEKGGKAIAWDYARRIDPLLNLRNAVAFLFAWLICASVTCAQDEVPKFEAGAQMTILRLSEVRENPVGVGGRFHYNFHRAVALDTEVSYFPQDPSGNFGETLALFGARAGKRWDQIGVFAKARAGVIHFGGSFFDLRLSEKTHPAFDVGGTLEYYAGRRVILRFDASDLIVPYGDTTIVTGTLPPLQLLRLGTQHNLHTTVGVAFRF